MIYLVAGVPSSGKSWLCAQLPKKFIYLPHDEYIDKGEKSYLSDAKRAQEWGPVVIETPFSVSRFREPLLREGLDLQICLIVEDPNTLVDRYRAREGREIPKGHLTRNETYRSRAEEYGAFLGTSSECLEWFKAQ